MKVSKLIECLQVRLAEYGDKDVALIQQTGPDSWVHTSTTAVTPPVKLTRGTTAFIIE